MERKNKLWLGLIILGLILILFFIYLIYDHFDYLDKREFEVKFEVSDKIGFNLNESILHFGSLIQDSTSTKNIIFYNDYPHKVKLNLKSDKNIKNYIYYEPTIIVDQNETKKIPITIFVPNGTIKGNYNGKLFIEIKEVI